MQYQSPHTFHVPVMGLAYTIDSPIKVARFGINSVISIIEDRLVEMMRKHYYATIGETYEPISTSEEDYRAKRITDYLNLVNRIVQNQVSKVKAAAFEAGTEIVKYFEMLPADSKLRQLYVQMTKTDDREEKKKMQEYLRTQVRAGRIDVNIMTKVDKENHNKGGELLKDGSDAVSALRGYANSDLGNSAVVFSAGLNPRLFNYLENCSAFDIGEDGTFAKRVIVKVSDYRSALIQGKYLAKKGIWVSEFRIESGLNCGGHAFATEGFLLGPILEEFKLKKQELTDTIFAIYNASVEKRRGSEITNVPPLTLSAQGGIGTFEEDRFLHQYYGIESTGWGTPFLLVPEATTVDAATLELLCAAGKNDVVLSGSSPLGVRFYYLKGTSGEKERAARINKGKPGSPCTEKHLSFNNEFTEEPICTASHKYQQLKIEQLQLLNLSNDEYQQQVMQVTEKECLCIGLSNAAAIAYDQPFVKKLNAVTICPGPNIVNFSKVVSLQTMVDHIYGRENIIAGNSRPHMFIAELRLYIKYLEEQLLHDSRANGLLKNKKYYSAYYKNCRDGIAYYRQLPAIAGSGKAAFHQDLVEAERSLDELAFAYNITE
ncbi:hypothetical protein A3860_37325 [Niastella vici]|uniref:Uncharacterized protein n=1 Tax=Niastella vici TaxID=1703345 RepID=A0A1V9FML9_9BACT|nr:hypothetical protein [Niastella vici]OQP59531.1 hypothetical protein A3860_37325 [Niastella vici]